ncbi:LexA family protein [Sodalis praecaptivus]|uniref:LexA family protein n=1 Tax=Sodalis praecaptivus TaxID=1239307 RepID=UPI0027F4A0A3|nr:LexA family transcriptional regulator [Sodalis praecaptivus]CAJ0999118.1 LexA repressor [Sodalis praecaptivus]
MKTQFEIIGDRLKRIREQVGLSQAQLAKLCGWASQSRIANYEKGARGIGADDALILSKILKVSPGELLFGEQSTVVTTQAQLPEYPLLSWVQAGAFTETDGAFTEENAICWVPTVKSASERAFWLEVHGDSMTSPIGSRPSFPEGMLILVDPDKTVGSGELCVMYLEESGSATFKKYLEDAGIRFLKPLNPQYPLINLGKNECKFVGKVIDARWHCLD